MSQSQKLPFHVATVDFNAALEPIKTVRHAVFVVEQKVDESLEWDGSDVGCTHVLAISADGHPNATGRISNEGIIGRMAVLKAWRGQSVGRAVLAKLIEIASEKKMTRLKLSSQLHAIPFYQKQGFRQHGDIYLDANIQHQTMTLHLNNEKPTGS